MVIPPSRGDSSVNEWSKAIKKTPSMRLFARRGRHNLIGLAHHKQVSSYQPTKAGSCRPQKKCQIIPPSRRVGQGVCLFVWRQRGLGEKRPSVAAVRGRTHLPRQWQTQPPPLATRVPFPTMLRNYQNLFNFTPTVDPMSRAGDAKAPEVHHRVGRRATPRTKARRLG